MVGTGRDEVSRGRGKIKGLEWSCLQPARSSLLSRSNAIPPPREHSGRSLGLITHHGQLIQTLRKTGGSQDQRQAQG